MTLQKLITTEIVYSMHIHSSTEKNACPASTLFQCSLIRSDAADADAAAAGHKTTQRRRRPPVRRRTALVKICRDGAEVTSW